MPANDVEDGRLKDSIAPALEFHHSYPPMVKTTLIVVSIETGCLFNVVGE